MPSGVLDTQKFDLLNVNKLEVQDYSFRSGCGCVSMYWDSINSSKSKYPTIQFIYNSSGNQGEISRYGVVYLYKSDTSIDSLKLSIKAYVLKTEMDRISLKSNFDTAIHFNTTFFDFDSLTEGENVTAKFKFVNKGLAPIYISSHASSCGCCYPTYSKEAVQPGKTAEVLVHFNSSGKSGLNVKSVTIVFSNGQRFELQIRAFVVPEKM